MSYETWKEEFYPIPASGVPATEAIAHSLQKWKGTTKEALAKHNVQFLGRGITEDHITKLHFDADSCSLCAHFIRNSCQDCPIRKYKIDKDVEFDEYDEACGDEYAIALKDSQPMIDLLSAVLTWSEEISSK